MKQSEKFNGTYQILDLEKKIRFKAFDIDWDVKLVNSHGESSFTVLKTTRIFSDETATYLGLMLQDREFLASLLELDKFLQKNGYLPADSTQPINHPVEKGIPVQKKKANKPGVTRIKMKTKPGDPILMPRAFNLVCERCEEPFTANGPRKRLCPICDPQELETHDK